MICASITMLLRVAATGARKMTDQGYTYVADPIVEGWFKVTVPNEGPNPVSYLVAPKDATRRCNCAFYQSNEPKFGNDCTCKHIEWLKGEEKREAELIASYEAHEQDREEARIFEGYGDLRQTARASHADESNATKWVSVPLDRMDDDRYDDTDEREHCEGDWDNIAF